MFKRLAEQADVVVENFRPDVKAKLGIDYESIRADQSEDRLWQHLRVRPGRPLSQAPRLRSDRPRHGRPDVGDRRPRRRTDAGRHPRGRPDCGPVLRDRHPHRAARARRLRPGPVGADLAATGADLHAGFPGGALADGEGSRQAGWQQPPDLDPDRRVQDLRRLHQHRHHRRPDLGALRPGDRRARPDHRSRLRHGAGALEEPRRAECADQRADREEIDRDLGAGTERRRCAVRADLLDRPDVRGCPGQASRHGPARAQ